MTNPFGAEATSPEQDPGGSAPNAGTLTPPTNDESGSDRAAENTSSSQTLALPTLPMPPTRGSVTAPLPVVDPANFTIFGQVASGGNGRVLAAYDRRLN